jgi:phosphohistidine swiveling domain-containing protein
MNLPTLSLDTPLTGYGAVHSGYNFREVCPEIISPLSWSIIGAGMEQGFRAAARHFGRERPTGTRPRYVSYFGFRPYFNMTSIGRLAGELLIADPGDVWELLLGGPGPDEARIRRPGRLERAVRTRGALTMAAGNASAFGATQAQLARAESAVLAAVDGGGAWQTGAACEAAIAAGRSAWALHIRTTTVVYAFASVTRAVLRHQYGDDTALELLRASSQRKTEAHVASARSGALPADVNRLNNYEIADTSDTFAPFSLARTFAPPSILGTRKQAAEAIPDEISIPLGTALGPVYQQLTKYLGLAIGERERSKELGLRALHCTRVLLDDGAFGLAADQAALLGVGELRDADASARSRLIGTRRGELAEAAALDYPVDIQQQRRGLAEALRPRAANGAGAGIALAPGWAQGPLVRESDGKDDRIVVGERVDGNYVLAVRPAGVVSRYGSVLSHVAIVCRELGIPFVAGIQDIAALDGRRGVLDGWSGQLSLEAQG